MEASLPENQRRIRVVTLVDRLSLNGGAENVALMIATRLDPARYESIVCASRWPFQARNADSEHAVGVISDAGVRLVGLGRRHKHDVWVWLKLYRLLRRERIDVLHSHMFGSNLWGSILGRAARVPVVIAEEHSWSYEGRPLRRLLDRHVIARRVDRMIAVSREDERRMIAVEKIPADRIVLVPNGVTTEHSRATGEHDVRAELGIAAEAPVIGIVGGLRAVKSHSLLVRAAATLAGRHPGLKALIVGDGPEREALEALIGELRLRETVLMLGSRTDVPDVLRALDVAVLCSESEGTPISVLEYMAAGLPTVATAVGGVPDLVQDGVHGLLVPPGDAQALASAISTLLDDPAGASEMGRLARERQQAQFSVTHMIERLEELYTELLRRRGIAAAR